MSALEGGDESRSQSRCPEQWCLTYWCVQTFLAAWEVIALQWVAPTYWKRFALTRGCQMQRLWGTGKGRFVRPVLLPYVTRKHTHMLKPSSWERVDMEVTERESEHQDDSGQQGHRIQGLGRWRGLCSLKNIAIIPTVWWHCGRKGEVNEKETMLWKGTRTCRCAMYGGSDPVGDRIHHYRSHVFKINIRHGAHP